MRVRTLSGTNSQAINTLELPMGSDRSPRFPPCPISFFLLSYSIPPTENSINKSPAQESPSQALFLGRPLQHSMIPKIRKPSLASRDSEASGSESETQEWVWFRIQMLQQQDLQSAQWFGSRPRGQTAWVWTLASPFIHYVTWVLC